MAKSNILIVEDRNILALDLQEQLKFSGYYVSSIVNSGEEAIQKAKETRPDVVLMDIYLKGKIDGIEAAAQISTLNIPVIYITAFADREILKRAKVTEPSGYLVKPVNQIELIAAIEIALHKKSKT